MQGVFLFKKKRKKKKKEKSLLTSKADSDVGIEEKGEKRKRRGEASQKSTCIKVDNIM